MFQCLECGHKFRTEVAAWRASLNGCPICCGVDIDLDVDDVPNDNTDKEIDDLGDGDEEAA